MIISRLQLCLSTSFGSQNQLPILGGSTTKLRDFGVSLEAPLARLKNGTIAGTYLPTFNQSAWLGIPFAKPPVGENRYRRPQSLTQGWKDIRPYNKY